MFKDRVLYSEGSYSLVSNCFKIDALNDLKNKKPLRSEVVLEVVSPGIEPGTHGFSVRCSTN